ncbi:MAG: hypothetical protein HY329_14640 [Chloroflexi bacterium]|nr:hypothetical protein [Chloroflexota bacterium]
MPTRYSISLRPLGQASSQPTTKTSRSISPVQVTTALLTLVARLRHARPALATPGPRVA